MDLKSLLIALCLVSAWVTYGLGFYVYAKNPRSPVNRLFLAVMLGSTYWGIGEFLIWYVNGYSGSWFWLKASSFWTIIIILTVHFVLAFTQHPLAKRENLTYLLIFLYLPALIISIIEICTDSIFIIEYLPGTGYYYTPVVENPVCQMVTSYFLLVMLGTVYLSVKTWQQSSKEKIRRQCILVSIGFLFVISLGTQSVYILPKYFGIHAPNLVFIGILFFSVIIAYAILKLDLFTLGPETAATNIIKTMPDGLILTDMDGTILTCNSSAAVLFQMESEKLYGRTVNSFIPETTYHEIQNLTSGQGNLSDLECHLTGSPDTIVSIASSLVRDPDGDPAGFILIFRNITGRKTAEKALRIANEKILLLSRLTRHDINNLITPLQGYLSLIGEDEIETPGKKYLSSCLELVQKITNHLQFSHQYHEIGVPVPSWMNLKDLIMHAISDLTTDRVEIEVSVAPVDIYADPLFQKVLYNLIENANRHGGKITCIQISTHQNQNGDLVLTIEDNGEGVRDEEKDLIFLHGYGKNSGLGLTISREILSVTEMSITETGVYGKGARFEILIPSHVWRPGFIK